MNGRRGAAFVLLSFILHPSYFILSYNLLAFAKLLYTGAAVFG
ncbi:MAG TPA: hypothetical protein VKB78_15865 [Pirellulales bacterium]|nr:hypothetical protein [Pirellulales bacterium]